VEYPGGTVTGSPTLRERLDRLADEYRNAYLDTDPVGLVHRYTSPEDREVAGLIVSSLSYGGAEQIRRSALTVLRLAGDSPASFALSCGMERLAERFVSFRHRWTTGREIASLFRTAGDILDEFGSIGSFVRSIDVPQENTVEGLMIRFSERFASHPGNKPDGSPAPPPLRSPASSLLPSPARGSACKRLAMYFRWMVRGPDGVDFGLWNFISPSRLVIPVDRHIARMGLRLGLTQRRTPDWKMALDITDSLRRFDADDPVRYDFALVRPGILGKCAHPDGEGCRSCVLDGLCGDST